MRGGLSVEAFRRLVESGASLPAEGADEPDWMACCREVAELDAAPPTASGLRAGVEPFARWAKQKLAAALAGADRATIREPLLAAADTHLRGRLSGASLNTLALALNIARLRGDLAGETPEERAAWFSAEVAHPSRRQALLAEFPMLDRIMAQISCDSVRAYEQLAERLVADRILLAERFDFDVDALESLSFGLGDPHAGGQTVAALTAAGRRLIYKPRSLASDQAFQGFLTWLNPRVEAAPPSLTTIDRGDYGWVRFVAHRPCDTNEEVRRCFRRMGALLAAGYICGASDVHYENVLIEGDSPHLIDLETLLATPVRLSDRSRSEMIRARCETVLRVGYLPSATVMNKMIRDVSAGGLVAPQESAHGFMFVRDNGLDDAASELIRPQIKPEGNLPVLDGKVCAPADYQDDLQRGFQEVYEAVVRHRHVLLGRRSPLKAFADCEVRWVPRPTVAYGSTLRASLHPQHLRNGVEREVSLASLMPRAGGAGGHLARLVASETDDMLRGDIPIFRVEGRARGLRDSRGRAIPNTFAKSGYRAMRERVARANPDELGFHSRSISNALSTNRRPPHWAAPDTASLPSGERLRSLALEKAVGLGERLIRTSLQVGRHPFWNTLEMLEESALRADITGNDLYGGYAGIGLFFAELFAASGDPAFEAMARRCRDASRLTDMSKAGISVGAFNGMAGLVYADLRISRILGDPDARTTRRRLDKMRRRVGRDRYFDIIAGSAGCLLVALRCAESAELEDVALATAQACVATLTGAALRDDGGASWKSAAFDRPLTGYSHGTTGIAAALASWARRSGDQAAADLAWEALRFEAGTFDAERGAWVDLRHETPEGEAPSCSLAWCHGAPGMTQGRQQILRLALPDAPDTLRPEIEAGLKQTAEQTHVHAAGLCHGTLGNIEPLAAAGGAWVGVAEGLIAKVIHCAEVEGQWRCGPHPETPGLMTGLAGIGLSLLKWSRPSVGSVLILE